MKKLWTLCVLITLVSACVPHKKLVYFQGDLPSTVYSAGVDTFQLRLQPADIISIYVLTSNTEAFPYFSPSGEGRLGSDSKSPYERSYVIDADGNVELLIVGKVNFAGLTINAAQAKLAQLVKAYVTDPVVVIKKLDFKVTVLGEVVRPGTFNVNDEKIRFTEAIALAGGLSGMANPRKVKIVRINQKEQKTYAINLNTTDAFLPENFYLQPNDLIYVEPLKRKSLTSVNPEITTIASILSTTILVITVLTRISF